MEGRPVLFSESQTVKVRQFDLSSNVAVLETMKINGTVNEMRRPQYLSRASEDSAFRDMALYTLRDIVLHFKCISPKPKARL
jgi:hypothetical protein